MAIKKNLSQTFQILKTNQVMHLPILSPVRFSQNRWFSSILVGKPLWFSSFGMLFWSAWRSKLFCYLRFRCLISWFRLLITKCPLLPAVWICWVRCYFFIDSVDLETFNRDASSYPFSSGQWFGPKLKSYNRADALAIKKNLSQTFQFLKTNHCQIIMMHLPILSLRPMIWSEFEKL